MAEKLDPRQVVTFEELVRAMMIEQDATRRVLVRKGLLTNEEVLELLRGEHVVRQSIPRRNVGARMETPNTQGAVMNWAMIWLLYLTGGVVVTLLLGHRLPRPMQPGFYFLGLLPTGALAVLFVLGLISFGLKIIGVHLIPPMWFIWLAGVPVTMWLIRPFLSRQGG